MENVDWEHRLALVWASIDDLDEEELRVALDSLVAELPEGDPVGPFEQGSAFDSTGHPDLAVERYRLALQLGLSGQRRRRAVIQLASSLRNLGAAEQSVALLTAELERGSDDGSDDLDDAVRAFLALALTSVGRDRAAVSVALTALAPHLTRYSRSLAAYAGQLT